MYICCWSHSLANTEVKQVFVIFLGLLKLLFRNVFMFPHWTTFRTSIWKPQNEHVIEPSRPSHTPGASQFGHSRTIKLFWSNPHSTSMSETPTDVVLDAIVGALNSKDESRIMNGIEALTEEMDKASRGDTTGVYEAYARASPHAEELFALWLEFDSAKGSSNILAGCITCLAAALRASGELMRYDHLNPISSQSDRVSRRIRIQKSKPYLWCDLYRRGVAIAKSFSHNITRRVYKSKIARLQAWASGAFSHSAFQQTTTCESLLKTIVF